MNFDFTASSMKGFLIDNFLSFLNVQGRELHYEVLINKLFIVVYRQYIRSVLVRFTLANQ